MQKKCVLQIDKTCINCGKCDLCDLDEKKICDNCMKCVIGDNDFISVKASLNKSQNHE